MFYRPMVFLLAFALFITGAASVAWASTVDKTPDRTITVMPSPSGSAAVWGVGVAPSGRTYATRYDPAGTSDTVLYEVNASGLQTPLATFASGSAPASVVVGSDNRVYVVSQNDGIYIFSLAGVQLGVIPAAPPSATPQPLSGLYTPQDVGVDASGKIYVTDTLNGVVAIFAAGTVADVAPLTTIGMGTVGPTGNLPSGIDVRPDGSFWVVNYNNETVDYFSGGVYSRSITGPNTGFNFISDVIVAPNGQIAVSQFSPSGAIFFFASNAQGNVAPVTTWTGLNTGLSQAYSMSYGPCGELNVATGGSGLVQVFGTCAPTPSPSQSTLPSTSAVDIDATQLWSGVAIALSGVLLGLFSLVLRRKSSR
jgi:streptogramin lyase